MPYTPDPTDTTNPIDGLVKAATAAPEFRSIKTYLRDVLLAGLNLRAPIANPVFTGRIVGADIHNHPSGASGAQYIASGTYTPTFSTAEIADLTFFPGVCQWLRVGNVVTVSGLVSILYGVSAPREFLCTLPIASTLTSARLGGAAVDSSSIKTAYAVRNSLDNTKARFIGATGPSGSESIAFSFTYLVV